MFRQEADWKNAATLICDVLRGSASLSVERHSSTIVDGDRQANFSSWSYEQSQPYRISANSDFRLFSLDHLEKVLTGMANSEIFFAYETPGTQTLGPAAQEHLAAFSDVGLSLVKLVVGEVALSWILVSLAQPRDLILWKMQYHLKDVSF